MCENMHENVCVFVCLCVCVSVCVCVYHSDAACRRLDTAIWQRSFFGIIVHVSPPLSAATGTYPQQQTYKSVCKSMAKHDDVRNNMPTCAWALYGVRWQHLCIGITSVRVQAGPQTSSSTLTSIQTCPHQYRTSMNINKLSNHLCQTTCQTRTT